MQALSSDHHIVSKQLLSSPFIKAPSQQIRIPGTTILPFLDSAIYNKLLLPPSDKFPISAPPRLAQSTNQS
jgi:hypothetical protein